MLTIYLTQLDTISPTKAHDGDAGWDVYSRENIELAPTNRYKFNLGFAIIGERGKVYLIQGRSGLAVKSGITTIGNVIDNTYRGEINAVLVNTSNEIIKINKGDKIAQLLIINIDDTKELTITDHLDETTRGSNGFGSTGI